MEEWKALLLLELLRYARHQRIWGIGNIILTCAAQMVSKERPWFGFCDFFLVFPFSSCCHILAHTLFNDMSQGSCVWVWQQNQMTGKCFLTCTFHFHTYLVRRCMVTHQHVSGQHAPLSTTWPLPLRKLALCPFTFPLPTRAPPNPYHTATQQVSSAVPL